AAKTGHEIEPDAGREVAVRARPDVVEGGRSAETVEACPGIPEADATALLIQLGEETGPLWRRPRRSADDEPGAVLEHEVAGRGVGLERDVRNEPLRSGRHAAARLEGRAREELAHAATRSGPPALRSVARATGARGGQAGAAARGGTAHADHVGRVGGVVHRRPGIA